MHSRFSDCNRMVSVQQTLNNIDHNLSALNVYFMDDIFYCRNQVFFIPVFYHVDIVAACFKYLLYAPEKNTFGCKYIKADYLVIKKFTFFQGREQAFFNMHNSVSELCSGFRVIDVMKGNDYMFVEFLQAPDMPGFEGSVRQGQIHRTAFVD